MEQVLSTEVGSILSARDRCVEEEEPGGMRLALPGDQMGGGEWRYHSSLNSAAGHVAEGT